MEEGAVLVTGATGQVGRATVQALVRTGTTPILLVRRSESVDGCTVIPDWLASDEAESALQQAATVVHLAGTLNPPDHDYERANIVPTQRVAQAVKQGRTRRLIFLSYVGASEESPNRYLSTKACAERLLQETAIPLTVFRCTHIIGPPSSPGPTAASLLATPRRSVTVLGNGKQRVAPIYLGDVVSAVTAAVRSEQVGTFDLQGPDEMSLDDLVYLLNSPAKVSIAHIPGLVAPLLRFVGPRLPAALIDAMVSDCRSPHPTASAVFGLTLTPLSRVWLGSG
jgi:NADH dehydrogenase (ubiquinone) 1 alpha subcomplex subunit 9